MLKKRDLLILGFLIVGSLLVLEFDDPILSGIEVESSPQFSQDINKSNLGGFDYLNGLEENFLALIVGKPMVLNKFMIFFDKYVGFVALIILCLFLISRVKKDRNISYLSFFYTLISTSVVVYFSKIIFGRERPFIALVEYLNFAFPSGHAAIIFCILPLFTRIYPKFKYYFYILASLVLYNRLYLGVHYFTDLIFGALIGYSLGYFFLKKLKIATP